MNPGRGKVIWFSGLSGAGKSSICQALSALLRERLHPVQILDADEVRARICSDLGYTLPDRFENIRRIAYVANLLATNGAIVLVAAITPLSAMRSEARRELPDLIEVFVDASLETCENRDPKGLYKKARAGLITDFTGIDSPYERPLYPHITCCTDTETIAESVAKVISVLEGLTTGDQTQSMDSRRKTLAVDFDGVIAEYSGWEGIGRHGPPRPDVVEAMTVLRREGWKIIVHTTRSLEDVAPYLMQHGIPYDEVNGNSDYENYGTKPVATVYWDDRALRYSGDARRDVSLIRLFRTWSGRV